MPPKTRFAVLSKATGVSLSDVQIKLTLVTKACPCKWADRDCVASCSTNDGLWEHIQAWSRDSLFCSSSSKSRNLGTFGFPPRLSGLKLASEPSTQSDHMFQQDRACRDSYDGLQADFR